jgi:hypothetical protein
MEKLLRKTVRATEFRAAKWAIFLLLLAVSAQAASTKLLGTVKSVNGNTILLTTDAGSEVSVTIADSARVLRTVPGQTDLKSATPIQASEIKTGDRVLALASGEGPTITASTVIVMKQTDIASKQQQEREEWRKGIGGIVKEVNASAGTITVTNALAGSGKSILIHVSHGAEIRRYSPDSVKFDDAKPGTLGDIKPGDQVRARGERNADGTEFTAQAIVSGTFRQIAGTVISTDAANNSITVMDLVAKKPVTLKVTSDSQMHKLPPFMAQHLAMRLKGGESGANGGPSNAAEAGSQRAAGNWNRGQGQGGEGQGRQGNSSVAGAPNGAPGGAGGFRMAGGGTPDFQQILSRIPSVGVSDLQKGDAVMLVATEGSANAAPTTITLLSGVEPILTAAPGGSAAAATMLSPWNLGASPAGGDASAE